MRNDADVADGTVFHWVIQNAYEDCSDQIVISYRSAGPAGLMSLPA